MEDYKFFGIFLWMINLSQQFCVLEVIFATKKPGLGLNGLSWPTFSGYTALILLWCGFIYEEIMQQVYCTYFWEVVFSITCQRWSSDTFRLI